MKKLLLNRNYLNEMNTYFLLILSVLLFTSAKDQDIEVVSPNKQFEMVVTIENKISYTVSYKGKEVISPSIIDLQLQGFELTSNPLIRAIQRRNNRTDIKPLYGKFKILRDSYNEVVVKFDKNFSLELRAYNDGVAYRFVTDIDKEIIT